MPSFLLEDGALTIDRRMQNRIHVDIDEIDQVLFVRAGHRIHGFIGKRQRIEKRLHRRFEQIHERLFNGKLLRSAQYRMLQNVKDARVIRRRCFERYGKCLIGIFILKEK